MNKFRMYMVATFVAFSVTLISASLIKAKPKDTRTPQQKGCDDALIACQNFCMGTTIQDVREKCQNNCWNKWNGCNGYSGRPRPSIPAPPTKAPIPRPTTAGNAQKSSAAATPSASAKPTATPKKTKNKQ